MTPELPSLAPPLWTQDQAIAFEAARECITEVIAICAAAAEAEASQIKPDAQRLAELGDELQQLARERAGLRIHDDDQVATVRAVYGARVRAHRAALALRAA